MAKFERGEEILDAGLQQGPSKSINQQLYVCFIFVTLLAAGDVVGKKTSRLQLRDAFFRREIQCKYLSHSLLCNDGLEKRH